MFRRTLTALLLATTFFACAPRTINSTQNPQRIPRETIDCDGQKLTSKEELKYDGGTRALVTTEYYLDLCQPHKRTRWSLYPNGSDRIIKYYYFYDLDYQLSITIFDRDDDGAIDTVIRDGIRYTDRNDPDRKERDSLQKFLDLKRK